MTKQSRCQPACSFHLAHYHFYIIKIYPTVRHQAWSTPPLCFSLLNMCVNSFTFLTLQQPHCVNRILSCPKAALIPFQYFSKPGQKKKISAVRGTVFATQFPSRPRQNVGVHSRISFRIKEKLSVIRKG